MFWFGKGPSKAVLDQVEALNDAATPEPEKPLRFRIVQHPHTGDFYIEKRETTWGNFGPHYYWSTVTNLFPGTMQRAFDRQEDAEAWIERELSAPLVVKEYRA